jgi:hypothetical protein
LGAGGPQFESEYPDRNPNPTKLTSGWIFLCFTLTLFNPNQLIGIMSAQLPISKIV